MIKKGRNARGEGAGVLPVALALFLTLSLAARRLCSFGVRLIWPSATASNAPDW